MTVIPSWLTHKDVRHNYSLPFYLVFHTFIFEMGNKLEQIHRHIALMHAKITKDRVALNLVNLIKEMERALDMVSEALGEEFDPKGHPDQKFGAITYAQHGDDLMLLNLFNLIGIEKPSYLDLGAHDPLIISNTALLYARGSRGINVEANPLLIPRFKELRPHDLTLNVGVGVQSGTATFYMYSDTSGRNTFSKHEVKTLEGQMQVVQEIELPMVTLPELINAHFGNRFPDLLSCDLEGMDYEVLQTLPSEKIYLPKIIVVETRRHETWPMINLLETKKFVIHCRMGENLFFVREDLRGSVI